MKPSTVSIALLACLCVAAAAPAQAQLMSTWVYSSGNDASTCSRSAPCATFAGAYAKTLPGGQINVIDAGDYGPLTITHALSITNDVDGEAVVRISGNASIIINANANDIIRIHGLVIDGATTTTQGNYGIRFVTGGALHVDRCVIRNLTSAGIVFAPSGISKLFVTDTILTNNGFLNNAGAITIAPSSGGSAKSAINRVSLENNASGITATASAATGTISTTVTETMVAGSTNAGLALVSPTTGTASPNTTMVDRSTLSGNLTGVSASGVAAVAVLNNSVVAANGNGLMASSGGQILSYQNNAVHHNVFQGAVTGTLMAQ